jgi:hypothetical protein
MANLDFMENVGGYVCPVDPAELVNCEGCQ